MQFDWNEANIAHIALHEVTPDEAEQVVKNDPLDVATQIRSGETRTLHLGETDAGRVLVVVVTERGEMLRVVTARPANKKERSIYAETKDEDNGQDP